MGLDLGSGSGFCPGSGIETIIDSDLVCPERSDPDPFNVRPDQNPAYGFDSPSTLKPLDLFGLEIYTYINLEMISHKTINIQVLII